MIYLCTCLPLWMFGRMKMWILTKLSRRLLHIYQMKFAFVSHSGPKLRILMSFSTAVLGFLSYKMYSVALHWAYKKLALLDLSYPGNFLITLVILRSVLLHCWIDSLLLPFCVCGSTFNIFALQKFYQCLEMTSLCLASINIACGLYSDI